MRRSRFCQWSLCSLVLGSLWLACERNVTRQPQTYEGNSGALADVSSTRNARGVEEKQAVPLQNDLLTRWKRDGLDGLGLDDITNGTTPALLDSYPRLPTRAPCWQIRNSSRCLPSFLLIGTMKAGTTALSSYLQMHENIYMSAKKEPGFFNSGSACGRHCRAAGHVHNLRFYFSLFPSLDLADPAALQAAIFEATPTYLFSSYRTPALIRAWLPDAKLLVMVRDPVERAYSQYRLGLTLLEEDRARPPSRQACSRSIIAHESFDRLVRRALSLFRDCVVHLERISDSNDGSVDKEEHLYYQCKQRPLRDNPCDNVVTPSSLLNPGLYSYHLERFFRKIPREQFHVLDTFELGSQPKETLRTVFDFVGVSQPDMSTWPSHVFRRRCPRFFGITSSKEYHYHSDDGSLLIDGASMVVGSGAQIAVHENAIDDRFTNIKDCESYPPMHNGTRVALEEFYAPHNARLYNLLGKDFGW